MLVHIVKRARRIEAVDAVSVTIPDGPGQEPLVALVEGLEDVRLSVGPEKDVLGRFAIASEECGAETVVRLWGATVRCSTRPWWRYFWPPGVSPASASPPFPMTAAIPRAVLREAGVAAPGGRNCPPIGPVIASDRRRDQIV